jgi:hypothetical protein
LFPVAFMSVSMNNPRHLAINLLRLLAVIERCPAACNRNSVQRLREHIDALHRTKLSVALPEGLDLESIDQRIDAILELERRSKLGQQHQQGEIESSSFVVRPSDQVLNSHAPPPAASAMPGNDEDDMRLALLTPKGAPSRKKTRAKADSAVNGKSVSMQVLRIESISKMNKQLLNGMQDIHNSAIKVEN